MLRLLRATIAALLSGLRSRRELVLENLALRQQLATVLQKRRPLIRPADRAFWVVLRRLWSGWAEVVVIVKPETVVGWHRAGFALYWRWLSKTGRLLGRPAIGRQVRDLVRRMASENGWGAPRIHGELLKLGFSVSERTVWRHMRQHRVRPEHRQTWLTFLRNHREVIVAMDFFVVPTATFRLLYVWFAIRHSRREVVHWSVTESPTAPWVVQQLREAFPFDEAGRRSRYLVFDRDTIFSAEVIAPVASMGLEPTRTSYQSLSLVITGSPACELQRPRGVRLGPASLADVVGRERDVEVSGGDGRPWWPRGGRERTPPAIAEKLRGAASVAVVKATD